MKTRTEIELLISKLDAIRNYGDRDYQQVVAAVRAGDIDIDEGYNGGAPVLRDAGTGQLIRGSGRAPLAVNNIHNWNDIFNKRAIQDFTIAYEALLSNVERGDFKSIQYFFDRVLGTPFRNQTGMNSPEQIEALVELVRGVRTAKTRDYLEGGAAL